MRQANPKAAMARMVVAAYRRLNRKPARAAWANKQGDLCGLSAVFMDRYGENRCYTWGDHRYPAHDIVTGEMLSCFMASHVRKWFKKQPALNGFANGFDGVPPATDGLVSLRGSKFDRCYRLWYAIGRHCWDQLVLAGLVQPQDRGIVTLTENTQQESAAPITAAV